MFCSGWTEVKIQTIKTIAKLHDSDRLKRILSEIETYRAKLRKPEDIIGAVEQDPEYMLIVEANNVAVEVDNEIGTCVMMSLQLNLCFLTH